MTISSELSKKRQEVVVIMAASEGIKKSCKLKKEKSQNKVTINAPYAYVEELAVTSANERNWRGIFIALLVIVAVLGLILFSIVLVSPPEEGPRNKGIKPSLEDIVLKLPAPAKFNGTWISGEKN
ncbi:hypothetical protein WA026_017525 [Henosepilachna vigintioctopunctata]|uniref:Uncharacterized protein n=1 Tax=Henosepilachna vigintioctopunctata TaxID=420089 RepID=A0AAW1UZS4_9CUCU